MEPRPRQFGLRSAMDSYLVADSISSQTWLLVAVACVVSLYAFFMRPMMRNKKDPLARSPVRSSLAQQRQVERQMETLLVELSQMARQITAQLDTRTAKLEALMKDADQKISELGSNLHQPLRIPERLPERLPERPPREDPRHLAVYELADAGLSAGQIAQRLSRPGGEIELILALR